MQAFTTIRMSSKGEVVIPAEVRKRLGLRPGAQLIVLEGRDVLILKTIQPPSMSEFDSLIGSARHQARFSELRRSDIVKAIGRVRRRK